MRALVTGVAGQLGHDVVNELLRRGEEVIGSDLAATYSGVQDGTAGTTCRPVPPPGRAPRSRSPRCLGR